MILYSRIIYLLSIALIPLLFMACDTSTSSDEINWSEMLNNYGNNIIIPAFEEMQTATNNLKTVAEDFEDAPTLEHLKNLQTALKNTRLAWQAVSPFQFGPAESILLRASLNTYPADDDKINDNISSGDYSLDSFKNSDAKGLPTLGYLLHGVGENNEEVLAKYTSDSEAENRMNYLQDNVSLIKEQVDVATSEWQVSGGDYIRVFLSDDNAGTDVGSSVSMLINSYVRHYERFLRDGKIGIPAGIIGDGVKRPTSTEAYYGGYSVELAVANMKQIERIFKGGSGEGLDDKLEARNAGDLSEVIQTQIDKVQSTLNELEDPLSQQIEENNEPVLNSFEALQGLVSLLKADMTVLGHSITYQDNDGD